MPQDRPLQESRKPMANKRKKKDWIKEIASQRIERLFDLASAEYHTHPELSNRYVQLARRIGMRYRVRIPAEFKRRMCKHCSSYLVYGNNARVRLEKGYVAVTCLTCGKQMRYPYRQQADNISANIPT